MKKTFYLILLLTSLFFKDVHADDIYEGMAVEKITIDIQNGQEKNILSKIKTHTHTTFSQFIFDEDLKKLSKEYDNVAPDIEAKDDKLFIYISLSKKPAINSISFKGNKVFKNKISKIILKWPKFF